MTKATKTPQERIDKLEHDINHTREEFNDRVLALESELFTLREMLRYEEVTELEPTADISTAYTTPNVPSPVEIVPEVVEPSATPEPVISESVDVSVSEPNDQQISANTWNEEVKRKPAEPSYISAFLTKFFVTILSFVLSRLTLFAAPFQGLTHKLVKLYCHYKEQGKAPVFLMTVAGLLTLTVGFGYLLQYSFHTLFNDTLKAITGFVIGAGIIGAGALLAKKKTDFREYAASVVALGVIFNFLTAYFIGPYYGIVSETNGFIILMIITILSFILATIYETRVVAFVTLVGGVFMPLIIGDVNSLGLVFVSYLFFLSAGNLFLSHKIQWPALSHITFVLSLSIIEYVGISKNISPLLVMSLLTGFFYMYAYNWSFQGTKIKEQLTRYDLTLLVSNVFYFIYAMLQVSTDTSILAGVLLSHAALLMLIVYALRLLTTILAPVYLLMIGLLVATSVFVLAPIDVASIIWAIEGLVLVYIGFHYKHKLIRAEGYAIYVIAILGLLWHVSTEATFYSIRTVSWYWFNLVAFGVLSFSIYRLIDHYKEEANKLENKLAYIFNEAYTFWGAAILSLAISVFAAKFLAVLIIIPMLWCFYRVSKHRLQFSEMLGFGFFVGFFAQIIIGMLQTETTVVTAQSTISWLVYAEIIFMMWGLKFYYQHFDIKSRGQVLASTFNHLVFYTPIAFLVLALVQINAQYVVNNKTLSFDALWFDFFVIGALILLGLWLVGKTESLKEGESRLEHKTILMETSSLYLSSFLLFTVAIAFGPWMFNVVAIPLIYLTYRAVKEKLPLSERLAWAHFILFGIMTLIVYESMGHLHFSDQSLSTKIAWAEVLFCAWAMRSVYDRLESKELGYLIASRLRIGVYLLIPLIFIPRVLRLYAEYLPAFIWLSFAISWLMYKKLNVSQLLLQLKILFFVALITTVLSVFDAINGGSQLPGLVSLIAGVIIITLFHLVEKTLARGSNGLTIYKTIQVSSPYFYSFALAAFCYAFTNIISISLLVAIAFIMFAMLGKRYAVVMHDSIRLAYLLVWYGLIAVPVIVFLKVDQSNLSPVVALMSIILFWYLTHGQHAIFNYMHKKSKSRNAQYWVFHGLVFITYTGALNQLFTDWSVGTSIAMLMHAVIVLFLTLIEKYKVLIRLSVVLYALTAAKVIFHDMNDFSHIHKVIALMCMGSILMLAAYLFQKARNSRDLTTV